MLQVQKLTVTKSDGKQLFHDLSFSVSNHDRLAIIGEEGNGKSTLLKLICQEDTDYIDVQGQIACDEAIAYLPQHFPEGWEGQGILDYLLKETPEAEIEMHRYNQLPEVERLWIKMNGKISFLYEETRLESLSGGEKVKLQLLKLMMTHCTLLCLDEPSNDLDLNTIKWLENWIRQLEIPCIFISHDEWLLRKCANQILHLEQVNRQSKCRYTLFKGSYDAYRSQRQSAYAKEVQIAHNEKLAYRKQMTRMNDIANAVRSAQNQISRQQPYLAARLKSKMHTVNAQIKRIEEKSYHQVDTPQEAITLFFDKKEPLPKDKCIISYSGTIALADRPLLVLEQFAIYARERIVIVGDNGCGKTTLLRFLHERLKQRDDLKVGYMPQHYLEGVAPNGTVLDMLCHKQEKEVMQRARDLLGSLQFTAEEMEHAVASLSDGQKAKLHLASLVLANCDVLLLDEPTRNLSPLSQPIIHRLLQDYHGCIICVSHDRYLIKQVFQDAYVVHERRLVKTTVANLLDEEEGS